MNTTIQIYQAIDAVSNKVNDINKKLDDLINMLNAQRAADIDYIAMETDVELEQEDSNE